MVAASIVPEPRPINGVALLKCNSGDSNPGLLSVRHASYRWITPPSRDQIGDTNDELSAHIAIAMSKGTCKNARQHYLTVGNLTTHLSYLFRVVRNRFWRGIIDV